MGELSKKYKTHSVTMYHRGIKMEVLCVTTSKKRFAELLGVPLSQISRYTYAYDLRYTICNENPDKLFAKCGLGGEGRYIFQKDEIHSFDDFKEGINEHRKLYSSYRDYLQKTNQ